MKYHLVSLLILVLLMSEVHSQCTCEIVDPWPRYVSGEEKWLGGIADRGDRGIGVCVEHYYGDYKIIITYYDWDYNVLRKDEFVNPIMYQYNCFWTKPPPYTEVVRVDLEMLSEGEAYVYWDLCVLCCPSTTTITTTETVEYTVTESKTQFIHDTRALMIIIVVMVILVLLIIGK
jgi:hypothetical protein